LLWVDVATGEWALLLLILLGQNQLMIGLSREWLRIGAELLPWHLCIRQTCLP
jgi:hypothetical protein